MSGEPIAIEKIRRHLDGTEETSFYACGPQRESMAEAQGDALAFLRLALHSPCPATPGLPIAERIARLQDGSDRDLLDLARAALTVLGAKWREQDSVAFTHSKTYALNRTFAALDEAERFWKQEVP